MVCVGDDWLVNVTVSGTVPVIGDAVNAAVGAPAALTVIVLVRVKVFCAAPAIALSVTV